MITHNEIEFNKTNPLCDFENVAFNSCIFRNCIFIKRVFMNCKFNNCYIGFNTAYKNVDFINCNFSGKYSSFGDPNKSTVFSNCNFENCNIVGTDILNSTIFRNTFFSGIIKNVLLRDIGNIKMFGTKFIRCNLSKIKLENVSIYGEKVFYKSVLPNEVIIIDNSNDNFLNEALNTIELNKNISDLTELIVLFNRKILSGNKKIYYVKNQVESFLVNDYQKKLFSQIINKKIS